MLEQITALLAESFPSFNIGARLDDLGRGIVTLSGEVDCWQTIVDIGHKVCSLEGVRNVVSDMTVRGMTLPKKNYSPYVSEGRRLGVVEEADLVIVGLGITGCAVARTLSKYDLKIVAVDMGEDVCTAASKANNGGVHCAAKVKPGTLKARLSVEGNRMFDQWAEDLGFNFWRSGTMTVIEDLKDLPALLQGFAISTANNDRHAAMIGGEEVLEIEPAFAEHGIKPAAGLWLPSQAKTHPYEVCVAMAENAADNGVKFLFNCTVGEVLVENGRVAGVVTNRGIIKARYIVNAAGVYSDELSEMAGDRCYTIHPRKGTLAIIDKNKKPMFSRPAGVYNPAPKFKANAESKGGGMDMTPSMNILLGPSATEVPDKEDIETTPADLEYTMSRNSNPEVTEADIIRIFAGTRPADFKEDYVIEMSPITYGFINAGAIQSPGLGSSPAVAKMVEEILAEGMKSKGETLRENPRYNPIRKAKIKFDKLSREEQDELIAQRPEYGRIVCRCESITEGEILDAIRSPIIPNSVDAIKRRTRAGMGRCQGGFCQPRVLEILARELGREWTEVNLKGPGTNILKVKNR